eukprot:TRINITY_DN13607_c0_g1_i1.p1 TRINITY_DN13607_c0_g1~~TRINITY_DN13607_c0_g1_i1.p1  ORF type:complete len:662 (-),score=142.73 TRINITY_DN13607_c0_g1_i1:2-1852(-)
MAAALHSVNPPAFYKRSPNFVTTYGHQLKYDKGFVIDTLTSHGGRSLAAALEFKRAGALLAQNFSPFLRATVARGLIVHLTAGINAIHQEDEEYSDGFDGTAVIDLGAWSKSGPINPFVSPECPRIRLAASAVEQAFNFQELGYRDVIASDTRPRSSASDLRNIGAIAINAVSSLDFERFDSKQLFTAIFGDDEELSSVLRKMLSPIEARRMRLDSLLDIIKGETWQAAAAVAVPLIKTAIVASKVSSTLEDPLDIIDHIKDIRFDEKRLGNALTTWLSKMARSQGLLDDISEPCCIFEPRGGKISSIIKPSSDEESVHKPHERPRSPENPVEKADLLKVQPTFDVATERDDAVEKPVEKEKKKKKKKGKKEQVAVKMDTDNEDVIEPNQPTKSRGSELKHWESHVPDELFGNPDGTVEAMSSDKSSVRAEGSHPETQEIQSELDIDDAAETKEFVVAPPQFLSTAADEERRATIIAMLKEDGLNVEKLKQLDSVEAKITLLEPFLNDSKRTLWARIMPLLLALFKEEPASSAAATGEPPHPADEKTQSHISSLLSSDGADKMIRKLMKRAPGLPRGLSNPGVFARSAKMSNHRLLSCCWRLLWVFDLLPVPKKKK